MELNFKMRAWQGGLIAVLITAGAGGVVAKEPSPEGLDLFQKKIQPVLEAKCFKCHSARSEKLKADLHLDSREGMLRGGENGAAIIAGDPDKSLLLKAIRYTDKDLQMPPKEQLSAAQVADFEAWVKMGAPWPAAAKSDGRTEKGEPKHWAWQPIQDYPLPKIRDKKWAKTPIDSFILAKLEEKKLNPASAADKRTLIRRATFDLIGLPPTPEAVEAFLADSSPQAFAKIVDRLLASPQYGERWARHWLDVVRYTDSADSRGVGGLKDFANSWRYRDWVVNAFNRDLPFDQFVQYQIAGDILATREGKFDADGMVATEMLALGNWGGGDADKEKLLTDIVDDQIDVTSRGFLGVTLSCARCHDHKFDPFTTKDYYGMAGIYFSSHILPNVGPKTDGPDVLRIPLVPPEEAARRREQENAIVTLEKRIEKGAEEQVAAFGKASLSQTARLLTAVWEFQHREARAIEPLAQFAAPRQINEIALRQWLSYVGTGALKLMTKHSAEVQKIPGIHSWNNPDGGDTPNCLVNTTDQPAKIGTIQLPLRCVAIHPSPTAGVALGWKSPLSARIEIHGRVADADNVCGDGVDWTLHLRTSATERELSSGSIPNGGEQLIASVTVEVQAGETLQLIVLPKREYTCDTTVIELEITEQGGTRRVWNLTREVIANVQAGIVSNPQRDGFGNADVWHFIDMITVPQGRVAAPDSALGRWLRVAETSPDRAVVEKAAQEVQQALLAPEAENGAEAKLYKDLTNPRSPFWGTLLGDEKNLPPEARELLAKLRTDLAELKKNRPPPIPMTEGVQEGGTPDSPHAGLHDVKVHIRGKYDRLGDLVPRHFPIVLAGENQPPITEGSGRLQLARWITSANNPLTVRVMVNRIWQHHFGVGIVRTPNNYGKLGEPPTHPELLDYLAKQFIASGWSVKAMHRAIMLSAAYQQSSRPDPKTYKADSDNKSFGWMNRHRLEAEALRDSLLAVSGQLDPTMAGPALRDLNNNRRTLYLMTIRSDRTTYRELFDAPDPTAIADKRAESTVSPQALFLLNHPFALKQAQTLATRLRPDQSAIGDPPSTITRLYNLLYARAPTEKEIQIGLAAVTNGGKDAWEAYCQILLCANEFMYVD